MEKPLKLYSDLAPWFHLLTQPDDYAEEAAFYRGLILAHCTFPPRTLLELGSGGGNNAAHLKAHFTMALTDLSPQMLALSQGLNPECEHITGDMRTIRLGRQFDAVFIHDAICYMISREDLQRAIETAYVHCRPGGVALLAPDFVRETFKEYTDHGGHDGEGRALRYLEWVWDPDPSDSTYLGEMAYLLRDETGQVRMFHDRHEEGLFSQAEWLRLLEQQGFQPHAVPFEHSDALNFGTPVFVGVKPVG